MANGLNRVTLVGNLGADPELKFITSGQAVLKLRIATSESFANKEGERQEKTEWHTVTMWGKRAEALNKILQKGKTVWIEGRLQTRSWEDKDGGKRYATEIVATDLGLIGGGGGGQRGGRPQEPGESQDSGGYTEPGADGDDVPF